jgi:cytochrome oxidase Cu insertion factor (SCO1/SenC/PrrC family)
VTREESWPRSGYTAGTFLHRRTEKYVVPHSAITYVLGPDGKFFTHFTDATEASDMAHAPARLLVG